MKNCYDEFKNHGPKAPAFNYAHAPPGIFITKFRFPIRLIGQANFLPISILFPDQLIDMVNVYIKEMESAMLKRNFPDLRSFLFDHLIGNRPL